MKIAVLGTGALGIALTKIIYEKGTYEVVMWTKFEEEKELVKNTRANEKLLPGVKLPDNIEITTDLNYAIEGATVILNCLPFVAIREAAENLKEIYSNQYICSTTKGVDMETFETTTEIFSKALNTKRVCALSGPSFAIEIANYYPISFVLASHDEETMDVVYDLLKSDNIYIDKHHDSIGVQLCGAIKNAVAIGSGILHGMNAADSTQAAYLARGIKDMVKIITNLEGSHETVYTYAGVGDLILTCMSEKSRNFSFGKLLGEGNTMEEAIEKLNGKTVEGIRVIQSLNRFMQDKDLKLDTIPKLYDILFNGKDIETIQKV